MNEPHLSRSAGSVEYLLYSLDDVADIIRDKVYSDENDKVGGVYDAAQKVIEYVTALAANEPQAAPDSLREALDNSQSLLVMMLELGEEYQAATIGRDPAGITEAVWNAEGLTKLLTEQITDNRAALSLSRPEPQAAPAWEDLTAIIRPMIESVCSDGNSDAARLAKDIADRITDSLRSA